jgi:CheY-like chemotaxis protein
VLDNAARTDCVGSEGMNRDYLRQSVVNRIARQRGESSPPLRPLRVLVIDDDVDTAESMSRLVKIWGHEVRTVNGAQAGLDLAVGYRPDLLLLDISMPVMNGCQLARQLRLDPRMDGCFIVAVTGYGEESSRNRCREAGVDLLLVKPVDPLVLESLLNLEGKYVNQPPK